MDAAVLIDLLVRGALLGLLALYIILFGLIGRGFDAARRGALLAFGIACYAINSSSTIGPMQPEWLSAVIIPFTIVNPVFQWWFTGALFKDRFPIFGWRLIPPALLLLNYVIWNDHPVHMAIHASLSVAVFVLVIWLPLQDRAEDLIERRRAIRAIFSLAAGALGIFLMINEWVTGQVAQQGGALLLITTLFGGVFLTLRRDLLVPRPALPQQEARRRMMPEDTHFLDRLSALMDQGVYREENLTVAKLAERVGVPEHRLRKIINQGLGYRNFSAFLNERRVGEAKTWLENPEHGLTPVSGLAYDLGYASLGPFNRAFKEVTGQTPTEYRRAALTDSGKD
jgi:AraC-like DNA-binding protein